MDRRHEALRVVDPVTRSLRDDARLKTALDFAAAKIRHDVATPTPPTLRLAPRPLGRAEEDRALEGGWIREAIAREARGRAAAEADRLLARSEAIGRALLGLVLILAAALAGLLLGGW